MQKEAPGLSRYPSAALLLGQWCLCLWWLLVLCSQCDFTVLLLALQGGGQCAANLPEHGVIVWVRWGHGLLLVAPGEVLAVGAKSQQLLCALWAMYLHSSPGAWLSSSSAALSRNEVVLEGSLFFLSVPCL